MKNGMNNRNPNKQTSADTITRGMDKTKETLRWKSLYESERVEHLEAIEKLTAQNRKLREELHEAQDACDRVTCRAGQLDKQVQEFQSTLEGKGVVHVGPSTADMEAYQRLSENYDSLTQRLHERTEELSRLREFRGDNEDKWNKRIRRLEERVEIERKAADKALKCLTQLETIHMEVVRSLRELNDRYIRLRQQTPPTNPPA